MKLQNNYPIEIVNEDMHELKRDSFFSSALESQLSFHNKDIIVYQED